MEGFKPRIKMKDQLTQAEYFYFKDDYNPEWERIARKIYDDATKGLLDAVKNGLGRSMYINLSMNTALEVAYGLDNHNYSYLGIWREIKKLADADNLLFYEIGEGASILTY